MPIPQYVSVSHLHVVQATEERGLLVGAREARVVEDIVGGHEEFKFCSKIPTIAQAMLRMCRLGLLLAVLAKNRITNSQKS